MMKSGWHSGLAIVMMCLAVSVALPGAVSPASAQGLRFDFNLGWDDPPPRRVRPYRQPLQPLNAPAWDDDLGDHPDAELYADLPRRESRWRRWRERGQHALPPLGIPLPRWERGTLHDQNEVTADPDMADDSDWQDQSDSASAYAALPPEETYGGYPDTRSQSYADPSAIQAEPLPRLLPPAPEFEEQRTVPPPAKIVIAPAPAEVRKPKNPALVQRPAVETPIAAAPQVGVPKVTFPKPGPLATAAPSPKAPTVKSPSVKPPAPKPTVATAPVIKTVPTKPQMMAKVEPTPNPLPSKAPALSTAPEPSTAPATAAAPLAAKPTAKPSVTRDGKTCPKGAEIENRLVADGWSGFADPEKGTSTVMMTAKRDGAAYRLTLDRCTGVVLSAKRVTGKQASN
jgi:hypothetical protein